MHINFLTIVMPECTFNIYKIIILVKNVAFCFYVTPLISCKMESSETGAIDQKLNYKWEILLAVYFAFNKMFSGRDAQLIPFYCAVGL